MAYWNRPTNTSPSQVDSVSLTKRDGGSNDPFYEIEPAIVLDIILDKDHPYFKNSPYTLNGDKWPVDINGLPPKKTDPDYTWMGRCLVRLLFTQRNIEKEELIWALPLDANPTEYPLLNEVVGVVFYLGQYYYTKQINTANTPNVNADFNLELTSGGFRNSPQSQVEGNRELILNETDPFVPFKGPISKMRQKGGTAYQGALGRYFYFNPRIRSLKRREGDYIVESRFGQSIRMAAYDDTRANDKGYIDNAGGDYAVKGQKYTSIDGNIYEAGGGNPMILIRNRQRPLSTTIPEEKNVGGYLVEDVNNDGSSIHMTSGITVSNFKTTCLKRLWGNVSEEQSSFNGTTTFKFPVLMGDQVVINSDRVIISSKRAETLHFSKKRYAVVTDDEYTVDAQSQIVLTTNNKTVLNSPAIYLGEYDQTNEPVLLGQTTVNWLYDLCQWLKIHTHWYKHSHPYAGNANPDKTQTTVQVESLKQLQETLNVLMSRRVFVVGGGLAPGSNGVGAGAVSVTMPTGGGVPGGFTGVNKKTTAEARQKQQSDVNTALTAATEAAKSAEQASAAAKAANNALNETAGNVRTSGNSYTVRQNMNIAWTATVYAGANANAAKAAAAEADKFSKEAAATDNDFLRIEAKGAASRAAATAKLESEKAEANKKLAETAAVAAKAETQKIVAAKEAAATQTRLAAQNKLNSAANLKGNI